MIASSSRPETSSGENLENPLETKKSPQQSPQASAVSEASKQKQEPSDDGLWESAVKNVFGPCVGVVDFASFFLRSGCRTKVPDEGIKEGENPVLKAKLKKPASRSRRRQGETLEFPVNVGFDDDVSAISAHTLEEMERLEMLSKGMNLSANVVAGDPSTHRNGGKKPYPGQRLVPPPKVRDLEWTYQVPRKNSNTSLSLGVSTSGSASSEEADREKKSP